MSTIAAAGVVDRDRSIRWAVVGPLCLGMVIAYIDRVNLTAAMPVIPAPRDLLGAAGDQVDVNAWRKCPASRRTIGCGRGKG